MPNLFPGCVAACQVNLPLSRCRKAVSAKYLLLKEIRKKLRDAFNRYSRPAGVLDFDETGNNSYVVREQVYSLKRRLQVLRAPEEKHS